MEVVFVWFFWGVGVVWFCLWGIFLVMVVGFFVF